METVYDGQHQDGGEEDQPSGWYLYRDLTFGDRDATSVLICCYQ